MVALHVLLIGVGGWYLLGLLCGYTMHQMLVAVEKARGVQGASQRFSLRFVFGNAMSMPFGMTLIAVNWLANGQGWRETLGTAYELMLAKRQGESCGTSIAGGGAKVMPTFNRGVVVNKVKPSAHPGPQRYLRISAGPLRDKYVHTVVAEAKLGRPLRDDETVEHVDGNGLNCSPENLVVVTRARNTEMKHERYCANEEMRTIAAAGLHIAGGDMGGDTSFPAEDY